MLKNFILIALRNFARHKLYSFINIFGLAVGIAGFTLTWLYVQDEKSYDLFHTKQENIYRVTGKLEMEGQGENSSSCPFPLGPTLQQDYPHLVKSVVRFFNFQDPQHSLKYEDRLFNETKLFVADSNVLSVFDFPLAEGDRESALAEPNSIILNKQLAEKYFGKENPIGKVLRFDGISDLKVTGILGDIPDQTHIHFEGLISFSSLRKIMGPNYDKNWVWNPCWTYVLLHDNVDPGELSKQFPTFINKHYPDFLKSQAHHYLQPLKDIHLTSKLDFEIEPNGDRSNIYIFTIIGIFILIIACINYMNLATARSAGRAKEVGVRKAIGAQRSQLILQFLSESLIIALIAVLLSLALVELFLPYFNRISGKSIQVDFLSDPSLALMILSIGLITGLVSGLYPALYLSQFNPITVLKGKVNGSNVNRFLKKGLVILQFSLSLILIISTVFIFRQLNHLQKVNLGFNKEQLVMIPMRPPMYKFFESFKNKVVENSAVVNVATMNDVVGKHHNNHEFNYEGMEPGKWMYFPCLLVDENFVPTMKMELVAGRNFSKEFPRDDSMGVIINETMVKHLNWGSPEKALGKQFYTPHGKEKVIGVVKDFNFVSLLEPVTPFVLDMPHIRQKPYWTRFVGIRMEGDIPENLKFIEQKWKEATPDYPFEYSFLDTELNNQYKTQANLGKLTGIFSLLAVFIACLGLFALASFTAEQRTKEIGIRKVLGASVFSVSVLLSKESLLLILVSNIIAWPLSWIIVNKWLDNFAYRTAIELSVFIFAALLLLIIAQVTVVLKTVRAANMNPVRALRYE